MLWSTQTEILKVDRRNKRMKIEMHIAGTKVQTWVEYEIVSTGAKEDKKQAQ